MTYVIEAGFKSAWENEAVTHTSLIMCPWEKLPSPKVLQWLVGQSIFTLNGFKVHVWPCCQVYIKKRWIWLFKSLLKTVMLSLLFTAMQKINKNDMKTQLNYKPFLVQKPVEGCLRTLQGRSLMPSCHLDVISKWTKLESGVEADPPLMCHKWSNRDKVSQLYFLML